VGEIQNTHCVALLPKYHGVQHVYQSHRDGLVHGQRHAVADCAQHCAHRSANVEEAAEPAECEIDFCRRQPYCGQETGRQTYCCMVHSPF
jgi:hypothetical protein